MAGTIGRIARWSFKQTFRWGLPALVIGGGIGAGAVVVKSMLLDKKPTQAHYLVAPPEGFVNPAAFYLERSQSFSQKALEDLFKLRATLLDGFEKVGGLLQKGDSHYNNDQRLRLASIDIALLGFTGDLQYLDEAVRILEEGLKEADPAIRWHPDIPYVRNYFELKLAIADLKTFGIEQQIEGLEKVPALEYCDEILRELDDPNLLQAHQVIAESVPGLKARAKLIKANILLTLGRSAQAEALYLEVIRWAEEETKEGFLNTLRLMYVEGKLYHPRVGVKYLGAQAKNKLAFMYIERGEKDKAFKFLMEVFAWEEVGSLKGPLHLAHEALIGAILSGHAQDLPWATLSSYPGLMESLALDEEDLAGEDRVEVLIQSLLNLSLPERMKSALAEYLLD